MLTINNKEKIEWVKGMTVNDVLKKMGYNYNLITVHVNDKFIPEDEYDTYEVDDESNIYVFHLAHGG